MFGAGFIFLFYHLLKNKNNRNFSNFTFLAFTPLSLATTTTVTHLDLFWIFLKIGAILYGSGYVLFAFLDAELVATGIRSEEHTSTRLNSSHVASSYAVFCLK